MARTGEVGGAGGRPERRSHRGARGALGLALVLALVCAGAPPPLAGPPEPPSVLLLGDSNIYGGLGKALAARLHARGFVVSRRGKPTSGLSRPDFFDWPREAARLLAEVDPDVVLFMIGGNDHQRLESPGGSATRIYWREPDAWREEYLRRVREMGEVLRRGGRRVFFLSPTNRAPRIDREDALRVSRFQAEALADLDGVDWVDTFALTTDERGRWLDRGRGPDRRPLVYRHADGIHLTTLGGELVADRLLAVLDERGLLACTPGARWVASAAPVQGVDAAAPPARPPTLAPAARAR